uniref:PPIase cyclophilin-type domain-containing protein n=1 Tax=Helicotheca tamesis TaxID=374047 RepID=A0A7S2HCK1_9STRA|mmetsp:Transcript_1685/g.2443  ORF Transcript_1685/g.2443 Transcript_1685/m.2443 type:complete len:341 (+) Transcript_1685:156-1178(+)
MMNSRLLTVKALQSKGGFPSIFLPIATTTTATTMTAPPTTTIQQQQHRTKKTKTGSRGSRGHGWYTLYRSGRGGRHLQGQYYNRDVSKLHSLNDEVFDMGSEFAYLDISVGAAADNHEDGDDLVKKESNIGRVVIQLATAALPVTTQNFKQLCLANPPPLLPTTLNENVVENEEIGYLHTKAHLIDTTIGIAFGDVLHNNGISGRCHPSIVTTNTSSPLQPYSFADESKVISHSSPGIVTMLSPSVHSNDSRFLIQTVEDAPHLDGRYVAFGRVVGVSDDNHGSGGGMDFLMKHVIKGVFTKRGRPTADVKIVGCGVLSKEDVVELMKEDDSDLGSRSAA